MKQVFELPVVICGKERFPTAGDVVEVPYANGAVVRIPRVTQEDVREVISSRELLHDIPLSEVSRYISKGGALWVDPNSQIRREAIDIACKLTGYSKPMLERDYLTIGDYLQFPNNLYELLDAEFGTNSIVDEWVANGFRLQCRAIGPDQESHDREASNQRPGNGSLFRSRSSAGQWP
jgi:long-chain-fatty-acyl-CoA reductase